MEDNYIHFSIDGRDLKINKDNPEDIFMWKTHGGKGKIKNPYWKQVSILNGKPYKTIRISKKHFGLHRVNYYAHNQDWDIYNSCIKTNSIDHEDRNKSNNNINNLRVSTHQHNQWNRNCKGYRWKERSQKWEAYIKVNGKQKYLGYFILEEDARNAYLEAKKIYHKIE
tara:strand:+ start:264 stop:767 length:504 start_codon:yes stop_codon:yes gene_type:complete